jgi:hypothetical protein
VINSPEYIENREFEVDGVKADGLVKIGIDEFPIFDVVDNDFYNTSRGDRYKVPWETEKIKTYMARATQRRPFYIRHNNNIKKIK